MKPKLLGFIFVLPILIGFLATSCQTQSSSDSVVPGVALLMHMDGTNGSTTFSDVHGHSFSALGDASLTSGVSKFGSASAAFDGNGDVIRTPYAEDFWLKSANFTIEFWWQPATTIQNTTAVLLAHGVTGHVGNSAWWLELRNTDGKDLIFYGGVGDTYQLTTVVSHGMTAGNWYHIAIVRLNNQLKIYINGVDRTSTGGLLQGSLNNSTAFLYMGAYSSGTIYPSYGNIDEVRITRGMARYTDDFTPPTAPFPEE